MPTNQNLLDFVFRSIPQIRQPGGGGITTEQLPGGQFAINMNESAGQRQDRLQGQRLRHGAGGAAEAMMGALPTTPFSTAGAPAMPTFGPIRSGYKSGIDAQNATFQHAMGMLDPQWQQQDRRREQELANRGLPISGEAYQTDRGNTQRERGGIMDQVAMSAVLAGQQAQTADVNRQLATQGQQFQQGLAGRQQFIGEGQLTRNQNLDELMRLMGMSQGQPMQQGMPQPLGSTSDLLAQQGLQNQQRGQNLDFWGNLIGAGANIGAGFF